MKAQNGVLLPAERATLAVPAYFKALHIARQA
jgi:hypothetical protein